MKTVADKLLKMLPCEVAKYYGSHLEKKVLDRFCHFAYFPQQWGLKLSQTSRMFPGNILGKDPCTTCSGSVRVQIHSFIWPNVGHFPQH